MSININDVSNGLTNLSRKKIDKEEIRNDYIGGKVDLVVSPGVGWEQTWDNIAHAGAKDKGLFFPRKVINYFKQEVSKELKFDEHKWTGVERINFFTMIKKCKSEEIEDLIVKKYKDYLAELSEKIDSSPKDINKKFLKISQLLTYMKSIPYNDVGFIRKTLDEILPNAFKEDNYKKIDTLIEAIVFDLPKNQLLSLSENLFNDKKENKYKYYTKKESEKTSEILKDKAKLYKQQVIGAKANLLPGVGKAMLILAVFYLPFAGTQVASAIGHMGVPSIGDIADKATKFMANYTVVPKIVAVPTVVATVFGKLLGASDYMKAAMWAIEIKKEGKTKESVVMTESEAQKVEDYFSAVYTKAAQKIADSLVRKSEKFYNFKDDLTKKDIAINICIIERINNPNYVVKKNEFISQDEADKINEKSIQKLIEYSNLSDPMIRSIMVVNNKKQNESLLFKMDILSNASGRSSEFESVSSFFDYIEKNTGKDLSGERENLESLDKISKRMIWNYISIMGKDENKRNSLGDDLKTILSCNTKQKILAELENKVDTEIKKIKNQVKDNNFKFCKIVMSSTIQPVNKDVAGKISSLSNELGLSSAESEIRSRKDFLEIIIDSAIEKKNNLVTKIKVMRDCFLDKFDMKNNQKKI